MSLFTVATIVCITLSIIFLIVPMISPTKSYGSTSRSGIKEVWKFIHSANYSGVWKVLGLPVALFLKIKNRRRENRMVSNGNYSEAATSTGNNYQNQEDQWVYKYGEDCGQYKLGDTYNGILISFIVTPIQQEDGSIVVYIHGPHIPDWQQEQYDSYVSSHARVVH